MVKISFQPAVAGIKADKADKASTAGPAPAAEILLTPAQEERPPPQRYRKGGSVGGVCYLSMGMVVLLMGLVFASVYIYRYFFLVQPPGRADTKTELARDNFFHCGVLYEDSLSSQVRTRMELEEDVKIYLEENYERINVPVPQFGGGDPADIIHDFQRGLTAYHDISLDKCYVIELNTTIVLPPRNFWELLMNVKGSTSEGPRTATPSATSRTPSWWRPSSVGWCDGLPLQAPPLPSSLFLFRPLWPSSLPSLSLYFGHLSIDVTCLLVPFQPCLPPRTRAVTSRGPTSSELPGLGDRRAPRGGFRDHRPAVRSAWAGPQLRWQPRGRAGRRGWARGGPGRGDRKDVVWGSEMSAQLGKSQKACSLDSPCVQIPRSGLRMGECPGMGLPRAQGKVES
uniref:Integral membrane protein 2C n=1 Tax=Ailuropoda melanoleuca TaxID=9646 RepID=G1MDE4_AILME